MILWWSASGSRTERWLPWLCDQHTWTNCMRCRCGIRLVQLAIYNYKNQNENWIDTKLFSPSSHDNTYRRRRRRCCQFIVSLQCFTSSCPYVWGLWLSYCMSLATDESKEPKPRDNTTVMFHSLIPTSIQHLDLIWSCRRFINRYAIKASSIDTENIQVVYSTNHDDWGYEPSRLSVMGPFCGRVFITTYGETWQKARALLRPTFSKSSISDLSSYKVAVEQFLRNIPNDGRTTVDLQPLLANLASVAVQKIY